MTRTTKLLTLLAIVHLSTLDAAAQSRWGSIYDAEAGPVGLASNKTARRVGDLVTVLISETQDVKNEEKSDLSKSSDLNYQLLSFDVKPDTFSTPLPDVAGSKSDNFSGQANYEKKGNLTARLTAIVMDRLPNGSLVVKGRREIRIDGEVKLIEISGIVRAFDVKADNTVESELVADARVSYIGRGPLTRSTNRVGLGGWLTKALDWLWPF